jgi:hypothetical protein
MMKENRNDKTKPIQQKQIADHWKLYDEYPKAGRRKKPPVSAFIGYCPLA